MKEVRIGLIGCGFIGAVHADCYAALDNVKVVAVADVRRELADAVATRFGADVYGDGKELLEGAEVDAVDICLPTYLHAKYASLAMEKAPYVFLEKPVVLTAEECDWLLAKQAETGCQVQVGHVIRFWDEYVKLQEYITDKTFGEVVSATFKRINPRPGGGWENWLLDHKRSGGAAQDLHIHDLDFVLSVFGKPQSSYSVINTRGEKNSYIGSYLQYEEFTVGLESTWNLPTSYPLNIGFRVVFDRATVVYAGENLQIFTQGDAWEVKMPKKKIPPELDGYYNELMYFTNCARNRLDIRQATLNDSVASLKFLLHECEGN